MYEHFDHTADLGLRVVASDLDALFCDAAEGLIAMIVSDPLIATTDPEQRFTLESPRLDWLLVDWLSELLYRFDTERTLFGQFTARVAEGRLEARAQMAPLDPSRHQLLHEVKAITYHGLRVEPTDAGWLAELIVDI